MVKIIVADRDKKYIVQNICDLNVWYMRFHMSGKPCQEWKQLHSPNPSGDHILNTLTWGWYPYKVSSYKKNSAWKKFAIQNKCEPQGINPLN